MLDALCLEYPRLTPMKTMELPKLMRISTVKSSLGIEALLIWRLMIISLLSQEFMKMTAILAWSSGKVMLV
jgi:hypothetical protein